jgi:nitrate reductase gamma subunit
MDGLLAFARGPLFALTFLFMILGLARHVLVQLQLLVTKGRTLRKVRWIRLLKDTLSWALPYDHLLPGTLVLTIASFVFHLGVILVPVFLEGHVVLWEAYLGIELPTIGAGLADVLTLSSIACALVLFSYRVLIPRSREMSRPSDYLEILLVVIPLATGFLASHPAWSPLPWSVMMLVHVLSAELLFVTIPFSKLSHMVLFPFDRLSQVHWQLRPGAGDRVAAALFGNEARV